MSSVGADFDELLRCGYRHVAESGRWDAGWLSESTGAPPDTVTRARRVLADLRVIEEGGSRGGWRAVSPRRAVAELVAPIEAEVRQRAAHAESLRDRLQMLVPIHDARLGCDALDAVQVVTSEDELTALVAGEVARCRTELVVMQSRVERPGPARDWYGDAAGRVPRIRTVFQHAARYHLPTEGLVDTVSSVRAQFRTAARLPVQLLVVDRRLCVLMPGGELDGEGDGDDSTDKGGLAVALRHPFAVALLVGVFEETWSRAAPFAPADPQPAWVGDEIKRSILHLLAAGAKDAAVARRLGISVRTCRRQVSELMTGLGAGSRFQAGAEAVRRSLV
jgi:DNA-binding CsgD family transcriptional regulator